MESPRRGYFRITPRGLRVLQKNPPAMDVSFLEQFPEFVEFRSLRREAGPAEALESSKETPEESLETAYQKVRQNLVAELFQTMKNCSPTFFERLIVDVLVKIGYGGTRQDAGRAVGRSGDDGIDGIIKEDRLVRASVFAPPTNGSGAFARRARPDRCGLRPKSAFWADFGVEKTPKRGEKAPSKAVENPLFHPEKVFRGWAGGNARRFSPACWRHPNPCQADFAQPSSSMNPSDPDRHREHHVGVPETEAGLCGEGRSRS